MRVSAAALLPVGRETAWAHLVRWDRQAAWMSDADEVRVLGGVREGVGTRIAVRTLVLRLPLFTDVLEVVVWDPPRLLRVAHTGFVRGMGSWRLDSADPGRTRFTWTEDVRLPVPVVGDLAIRAYAPFLRRVMKRSIAGLRRDLAR